MDVVSTQMYKERIGCPYLVSLSTDRGMPAIQDINIARDAPSRTSTQLKERYLRGACRYACVAAFENAKVLTDWVTSPAPAACIHGVL